MLKKMMLNIMINHLERKINKKYSTIQKLKTMKYMIDLEIDDITDERRKDMEELYEYYKSIRKLNNNNDETE